MPTNRSKTPHLKQKQIAKNLCRKKTLDSVGQRRKKKRRERKEEKENEEEEGWPPKM
jgi:hypothetical protein